MHAYIFILFKHYQYILPNSRENFYPIFLAELYMKFIIILSIFVDDMADLNSKKYFKLSTVLVYLIIYIIV